MPPESEAQRKAMAAAAEGKSDVGIPEKVGKEFIAADPGGELPDRASKLAKRGMISDKSLEKMRAKKPPKAVNKDTADDAVEGDAEGGDGDSEALDAKADAKPKKDKD